MLILDYIVLFVIIVPSAYIATTVAFVVTVTIVTIDDIIDIV